jgi:excisionase family DNA binding protein
MTGEALMNVKEVAVLLKMSEQWVRAHAAMERRPHLPSIKLGKSVRFRRVDVETFVQDCERMSQGKAS